MTQRRTRIKFCGLTRIDDVRAAVSLGVDAVGFILVPGSARCLAPESAADLRASVPPLVSAVMLVKDPDPVWLQEACAAVRPDLLQFHGSESVEACTRPGLRYLKAVPMGSPEVASRMLAAHASAAAGWVLDAHAEGGLGGTGSGFDWASVPALERPLVLAGGLRPDNVERAVMQVRPFAVDVSSGIESAPGHKDPASMRRFIEAVRRADRQLDEEDTTT